ncbi:lysylphosphatidylglycerol synthase transmembrane domain-containing protein [Desulfosporosinus sp. FKA]|uniref:lysylphosphatidylglycerol synthase transmembrane domain-containing protein n=1 Tax=Desulfosporosinus sp. FKA TaxID=1969834 RepID=UPI000B49F26F|nr:lysylphosphatidylglycerol synthase transmembrane domain-containing protein [Desulfosporosinus sp. FKA]
MIISGFSKRRLYSLILFFVLVLASCLIIAQWDREKIISAIQSIGLTWLCLLLMLSLLNYVLRIIRWQNYLRFLGANLPVTLSALIYVTGFALTMTPGKAGELYRGVFLKTYGVTYADSIAVFVSERISDLSAILLLIILGIFRQLHWFMIISLIIVAVIISRVLLPHTKFLLKFLGNLSRHIYCPSKVRRRWLTLLIEARRCHSPRILISATFLSLLAWSSEAVAFYLLLYKLGFSAGLLFALYVYALATLAGAISFLPGGLGGTEAVMTGLLLINGMPATQAIAATVIIRLTTLWFAVFLGVIALVLGKRVLVSGTEQPGN